MFGKYMKLKDSILSCYLDAVELDVTASLSVLDLFLVFHKETSFTHFCFIAEFRIYDRHHILDR